MNNWPTDRPIPSICIRVKVIEIFCLLVKFITVSARVGASTRFKSKANGCKKLILIGFRCTEAILSRVCSNIIVFSNFSLFRMLFLEESINDESFTIEGCHFMNILYTVKIQIIINMFE